MIMQQVNQYSRSLQGKYVDYLSIYKVRSHIQLLSRASLIRISAYSVIAVIRKKYATGAYAVLFLIWFLYTG